MFFNELPIKEMVFENCPHKGCGFSKKVCTKGIFLYKTVPIKGKGYFEAGEMPSLCKAFACK
jgi:hypothetical protein